MQRSKNLDPNINETTFQNYLRIMYSNLCTTTQQLPTQRGNGHVVNKTCNLMEFTEG